MTGTFALLTGATIILGSLAIAPPADAATSCFGGYCGYYGYSPDYPYPYGYGPGYTNRAYPYRPGHPYEFHRELSGRP
jgi:hypothetical protein